MVVSALIAARNAGLPLDFDRACAIDLASKLTGKSLFEVLKSAIHPRVIQCPPLASGQPAIDAVAGDGVHIKARVTLVVRTNLERCMGGATEEIVLPRVMDSVAKAISAAGSSRDVLGHPEQISRRSSNRGSTAPRRLRFFLCNWNSPTNNEPTEPLERNHS